MTTKSYFDERRNDHRIRPAAVLLDRTMQDHRRLGHRELAARVAAAVGGTDPRLSVSRIDSAVETREYTEAVLSKSAPDLDAQGIALLEEDLRSPGAEEIAVFNAFARTVAEGE